MKRIYISGPITGMQNLNFPAFHAEAKRLRALGYEVVNPAEINPDPKADWTECLRALADSWPRIGQGGRHDPTEYLRRDALVASANEAHRRAVDAGKRLSCMKRPPKWLLKAVAAIAECTGPLSSDLAEYRDIAGGNPKI